MRTFGLPTVLYWLSFQQMVAWAGTQYAICIQLPIDPSLQSGSTAWFRYIPNTDSKLCFKARSRPAMSAETPISDRLVTP